MMDAANIPEPQSPTPPPDFPRPTTGEQPDPAPVKRGRPRKKKPNGEPPPAEQGTLPLGTVAPAPETPAAPAPAASAPALPEITSAEGWRKAANGRWRLSLPSGVVVLVRRVDMGSLMLTGIFQPEELAVMSEMMQPTKDRDVLLQRVDFARRLATQVVTAPRVVRREDVPAGTEGVIYVDEVPETDALLIMVWVLGGVAGQRLAVPEPD
jgi:hypothetical protein